MDASGKRVRQKSKMDQCTKISTANLISFTSKLAKIVVEETIFVLRGMHNHTNPGPRNSKELVRNRYYFWCP